MATQNKAREERPARGRSRASQNLQQSRRQIAQFSDKRWYFTVAAIVLGAAALRLSYLTSSPLHHDEGVNGFFLTNLFRNGFYRYDPANYHGPSLYYFALVSTTINALLYGRAGLSTFAIRIVPAAFGTGIVWLILSLRRQLGTYGAIAAALLIAVSPGEVFFSRYFIHEILLVFFTLGVVVAAVKYEDTLKPDYLVWAAISAALMCATKETWVITGTVLSAAALTSFLYVRVRCQVPEESIAEGGPSASPDTGSKRQSEHVLSANYAYWIGGAALSFAVIWVSFYSSFFANFPQGVYDSVLSVTSWTRTGTTGFLSPWFTHLQWIYQEELPSLVFGVCGIAIVLLQARSRFVVFLALWTLGMSIAYSSIPYKTPWLSLNISLPLAIIGGYALGRFYEASVEQGADGLRIMVVVGFLIAILFSSYQAINLSFFRFDDDSIPYVFAHTRRDFFGLLDDIQRVESHNHLGDNMGITVVSPEHWPLSWYLRDNPNVAYTGKIPDTNQPVIIALDSQADAVERKFSGAYRRVSSHELRPGCVLVLYLRNDLLP